MQSKYENTMISDEARAQIVVAVMYVQHHKWILSTMLNYEL